MTKVFSRIILVLLLIVIPIVIMAAMGLDRWDANEGLIFSVAIFADLAVYLAYRFLRGRFSI